jgi:hypothetical protein
MSSWPHRWRKHASHVGCRLLPAKRTPYQTQEDPAGSAWFLRARFGGPVRCWTYKVQIAANACTNPVAMACRVGGEKEIVRLCGSSTSVWWLASVHWPTHSSLVVESSHLSSLPMHANSPLLQQPKRWPRRCAATRTPEHGSYSKRWWLTVCTAVLLSPLSSLIALDVSRSAMNPSNERLGIR